MSDSPAGKITSFVSRGDSRRRFPRVLVSLPIRVEGGSEGTAVGHTVDLSASGGRVTTDTPLVEGDVVVLELPERSGLDRLRLPALVWESYEGGAVLVFANVGPKEFTAAPGISRELPPARLAAKFRLTAPGAPHRMNGGSASCHARSRQAPADHRGRRSGLRPQGLLQLARVGHRARGRDRRRHHLSLLQDQGRHPRHALPREDGGVRRRACGARSPTSPTRWPRSGGSSACTSRCSRRSRSSPRCVQVELRQGQKFFRGASSQEIVGLLRADRLRARGGRGARAASGPTCRSRSPPRCCSAPWTRWPRPGCSASAATGSPTPPTRWPTSSCRACAAEPPPEEIRPMAYETLILAREESLRGHHPQPAARQRHQRDAHARAERGAVRAGGRRRACAR